MNHLASWYRRAELHAQAERTIAEIVLETGEPALVSKHAPTTYTTPGDARQLRGIPVVGVHGGMGGAITGSKPHSRQW